MDRDRSDSRHTQISDCAESCREAEAHALGASGVAAPTVAPQHSCFKCLSTDTVPIGKTAPYLAPRIYLCRDCIRPRSKQHARNAEFGCGCAWNDERCVRLDLDHAALVAAPPDPGCVGCSGTGKIRDRHHYLGVKASVGATDAERGRRGHSYQSLDNPLLAAFPSGGWVIDKPSQTTGNRPGRPKTTISGLDVTKIYMTDAANEILAEHAWTLALDDEDFCFALGIVTDLLLFRAKSANPRVLSEWLPMSTRTIYRWRKRGERMQSFFDQMDRIENLLQHTAAVDELRWAELFHRVNGGDEHAHEERGTSDLGRGTKP